MLRHIGNEPTITLAGTPNVTTPPELFCKVFGLFNFLIPSQIFRIVRVTIIALAGLFEHLRVFFILNNLERQVDRPESGRSRSRNMLPSMQQEFFKDYSFSLFPQFPTAI
jgi:hypothetical protein